MTYDDLPDRLKAMSDDDVSHHQGVLERVHPLLTSARELLAEIDAAEDLDELCEDCEQALEMGRVRLAGPQ